MNGQNLISRTLRMKKSSKYILSQIRQEYKISDYLASKGIFPKKKSGNKWYYVCPVHDDTNPSFCLYLPSAEENYENFFCFACKKGTDIVSLVSYMEFEGNWRKAIEKLSGGINVSVDGEIEYIIGEIKRDIEKSNKDIIIEDPFHNKAMELGILYYNYLKNVNFDNNEVIFLDGIYRKIDEAIKKCDMDTLDNFLKIIVDDNLLGERLEKYLEKNNSC